MYPPVVLSDYAVFTPHLTMLSHLVIVNFMSSACRIAFTVSCVAFSDSIDNIVPSIISSSTPTVGASVILNGMRTAYRKNYFTAHIEDAPMLLLRYAWPYEPAETCEGHYSVQRQLVYYRLIVLILAFPSLSSRSLVSTPKTHHCTTVQFCCAHLLALHW